MRKFAFLATAFAFSLFANLASAQQADAMIGGGTLMSPSTSYTASVFNPTIPEKGGFYPSISADVIFHRRIGINFETAWRGGQGEYGGPGGQPYRPILFDFNGVYQPKFNKKVGADLMGGIGWQTTRFYGLVNTSNCFYFGACYVSDNHFLVHVGGGVRYYFWGHVFFRPEVHYYHIVNQDQFSNPNVFRVGASIGYTIGPD